MKAIDIALKDLIQSFRSLFLIGMVIVAPLVITGLLFFAFGGIAFGKTDLPKLYLGVVNLDQPFEGNPPLGDKLVDMVNDESVSSWLTASSYPDETSARAAVDRQEIGALMLLPADLTKAVYTGGSTRILIIQDPTLSITPSVVRDMVSSFLDGISGARAAITTLNERTSAYGAKTDPAGATAITSAFQVWFQNFQTAMFHSPDAALVIRSVADPEDKQTGGLSRFLSLAMVGQMIFFSFFTGGYAMMSILREEEEGTLQRLFTTPTDRTLVLTGKYIAVFLTVTLQTITLMTIGRIAFGIRWGDPMGVFLAVLAQVTLATGMGVLVISLVRSTRQAGPVLGGVLTFLAMMGGLFTSNIEMPASFTALSRFTPQGWVLENWRFLLAGSRMESILVSFLVSIALGILFFIIGAFFFRRRYI